MQFVKDAPALCVRCGHCIAACPEDAITIGGMDMSLFPPLDHHPIDYKAFLSLLDSRRSVRMFTDQPVDAEVVDNILAAVATAPSGMGLGPPPVCVINGRDKIAPMIPPIMEFYRKFQKGMKGGLSRIMMRMVLGKYQYTALNKFMPMMDRMIESYDRTGADTITWGAPLLMIFHAPRSSISGDKDATIACTYAMLAAHAQGLGTTMIGMVPPYIERTRGVRRRLDIPDENAVVLSLIAGHSKVEFSHGIRKYPAVKWV